MNRRWNHDYIRSVRRGKEKYRDSPDLHRLLDLVSESMYGTSIHWALELIQNAEDEEASRVCFTVFDDHVLVENDGEPFNRGDVESICSAAHSFKQNKIGFFGIGFKSVFHISYAPQIISGRFSFQIQDYLYPEPIDVPENVPIPSADRGATFLLSLKQGKAGTDLIEELQQINDRLLLFLSSVSRIEFRDQTGESGQGWVIERSRKGQRSVISNSQSGQITTWRVFSRLFTVPSRIRVLRIRGKERAERTKLVIAFPYPDQDPYPDLEGERLYCFLPTRRRTDLPFLVHGDFIPTLGREDIDADNPWNLWLLERLPTVICQSFLKLRRDPTFRRQLFDYLRLPGEVADEDFQAVALGVVDRLSRKAIAPVNAENGEWDRPECVAIVPSELKDLIGPAELTAIYGSPCRPLDCAADERTREVLTDLGTDTVDYQEVVALLNKTSTIEPKRPKWFLGIYDYLARRAESLSWPLISRDVFEQLRSTPFLLTSNRTLVKPAADEEDRLITHHPQTKTLGNLPKIFDEGELVFLHPTFQLAKKSRDKEANRELEEKRGRIREFLDEYGVARGMRPYDIIKKVVLAKFQHAYREEYPTRKVVVLTNYIRENLESYVGRVRSQRTWVDDGEIHQEISEKLFVRGSYLRQTKTEESDFRPSELYLLPSRKEEPAALWRALQGLENVPFVSRRYYDGAAVRGFSSVSRPGARKKVPKWNDFFKAMGVWDCPRLLSRNVRLDLTPGFEWVPYEYSTRDRTLREDKYLPELEPLIDLFHSDPERYYDAVIGFRDAIARNWSRYENLKWSTQEWYFRKPRSQTLEDASFVHQLREMAWLPLEDYPNQLFVPCDVYFANEMNAVVLPPGTPLLESRRGRARAFFRAIGVKEKPSRQAVLDHLVQLRANWRGEEFPQDWPRRMGAIYKFLFEPQEAQDGNLEFMDELVRRFEDDSLVFLPTPARNWWSPSEAFWEDKNDVFGPLRAYLSLAYSEDARLALETAGVRTAPSLHDCVEALEELSAAWESWPSGQRRSVRPLIDQIYAEMCSVLKHEGTGTGDGLDQRIGGDMVEELPVLSADASGLSQFLQKPIFLATDDAFHGPGDVCFCDDERLRPIAEERLKILQLQTNWRQYLPVFEAAGIMSLSTAISRKPIYEASSQKNADNVLFIRELSMLLKPYLKYHHPEVYAVLSEVRAFDRLQNLSVKLVPSLSLEYEIDGWSGQDLNVEAFYDTNDNGLYVVAQTHWLTSSLDAVSSELAAIFRESEVSLKTQIESLLSCGFDRVGRNRKFDALGIPPNVLDQFQEAARLVLVEGTAEYPKVQESTEAVPEEESEIVLVEVGCSEEAAPIDYVSVKKVEKLISPDDILSFTRTKGKRTTRYSATASRWPRGAAAEVTPKGSPKHQFHTQISTVSTGETEAVALGVIMRYEVSQGRQPIDHHRQSGLGYDVESSGRFIEVKSSKGNPGRWRLTSAEWEAAERHGDSYHVYVVSDLLVGRTTRIQVIQNPTESVDFHVPGEREARNWQTAILEDIQIGLSTAEPENSECAGK